jgi:endogenous inhibitor of DNA gyrase (YacG/DUF329 family)
MVLFVEQDKTKTIDCPRCGDSTEYYPEFDREPFAHYCESCYAVALKEDDIRNEMSLIAYDMGLTGATAEWLVESAVREEAEA